MLTSLQVHLLFANSPLFIMAYLCPICSKNLTSEQALNSHTGTKDAALRRAHTCHKCHQEFCSQKSMEQHLDGPSHSAMFTCDVCKRSFGSKQAVGQHQKMTSHKQMLARANSVTGAGASSGSGNVNSHCFGVIAGIIRILTCIRGFILPSAIPLIGNDLHFHRTREG